MQEHESHRHQCVGSYKCCSSSECIYICHMTPPLLTLPAAAAQCKPNSGPDNNVDAIKRFFQDIEANAAAGQETFLPQEVKLVASDGVTLSLSSFGSVNART